MFRLPLIAVLLTLSACCTLMPGTYGTYERCMAPKLQSGWTHHGEPPPRCTDAVLAAADTLLPDPALHPLHGLVVWRAAPFECSLGQKVWGCSTLGKSYVNVQVALPPSGHAADSALPEEVAHWVWSRYRPGALTEEWRVIDGKQVYWRDPDFKAWFNLVQETAHQACP